MSGSITGLSSMATRGIIAELARSFEGASGSSVAITSLGGVDAAGRVRAGEAVDVVVLASDAMDRLACEGHVLRDSLAPFAASGIAAAIPAGAARPDLRDADAVRRATLAADRLCYSTGPSGTYLRRLWEDWGIDVSDPDRALLAPPGVPVGTLLAQHKGDLGFQQLSELIGLPGIEVVGPLPEAIQLTTVFTVGIGAASRNVAQARELIAFLVSSDTDPIKERHGMSPPR